MYVFHTSVALKWISYNRLGWKLSPECLFIIEFIVHALLNL